MTIVDVTASPISARQRWYGTAGHAKSLSPTIVWDHSRTREVLPRLVSTSEVNRYLVSGPLKGLPLGGLVDDQQGGNKCLTQGEAKCTYSTGSFLVFCMATDIVYGNHGLLSLVRKSGYFVDAGIDSASQFAYRVGSQGKTFCALEGASKRELGHWILDVMQVILTFS